MLSRITLDGNERQKMASINQILNQVGALAVTTFMVVLVEKFGWTGTALIYGIATAVCILIGFLLTKEHIGEDESGNVQIETVPLKVALPAMLKNKYFYLLTLMFVLILMQAGGPGSVTYYYCNNVLGNLGILSFISACGIVPAIVANLFVPVLAQKFGRRKLLIIGALGNAFGFLLCGIGATMLPLVYIGMVIKGFFVGFLFSCGFAMASDVVDYGEWKTGIRSEGLINSCVSFGQKVGLGLGPAVATWILAFGGYDGTAATQTASAIHAINFSFSYYGVILSLGIAILAFFMDIDKHADEIRNTLTSEHE
jgi:GPH family glycoside/pentoside/hexuronide:cation symporter